MIPGITFPHELLEELLAMDGHPTPEIVLKVAELFDRIGRAEVAAKLREARYDVDRAQAILDEIAETIGAQS